MRELLPLLPKPSRYAGIEDGACRKDPARTRLRLALAFPDTYEVGMSYLGQKILYGIVNAHEDWWAERVMAPDREAGAVLRANNAPLCTLESDTPLADLHCVSFSITHELCYTNVLYMLDLAGIPLRSAQRSQDLTACPLVIAGGGALLSAEPLTPFMDLMVLGDGEESLPDVLHLLERALDQGWSRDQLLRKARLIPGVYVPSLFSVGDGGTPVPLLPDYTRPARRIVADLNAAVYPTRQVVPVGAVHNRLSLEIARGCTRGCRFCHAGMVYRPVRERSLANITSLLDGCLRETGFDEISFLSLSTGDFSALKTLCHGVLDRCAREQISLSLPSLRVGSIDDEIIERMADLRRTGCTLAPEAGSQRLRDVINKGVSEEDLLLHAQKLLEHGWRQVKLYFMIGLPTETDEDLAAIAELCRKVRDAAGRGGPRLQVTGALSSFVPKPFTPFQWEAQISREEISRRVHLVRALFKGQKCLKLRWHEPAMSHLEGILSRADRRMADVVEKAYRKGAIFCSWMEDFDIAPWLEALDECGISVEACTGPREPGASLPWNHLEAGVSEDFLLRERERALAGKITQDCRYGVCRQCGACDTRAAPSRLPHTAVAAKPDAVLHRNRLIFAQRDQDAHEPRRNEEGWLICRVQSNRPPQISEELTHKAAQYRIWHSKMDGSAYLSQLELQAVLERALRRTALPLAFSQGFHPLPLLSFGRALPVGVESRAEWFSLTLRKILAPQEVAARLNPLLPPGMSVLRVDVVDKSRRTEHAAAETFSLSLPTDEENAAAVRCFADFAALSAFPHTRQTKKGPRSADIRPLLLCWEAGPTPSDTRGGADAAVTFVADWRNLYLSPLLFCLAVLAPLESEEHLRPRLRLLKTAQTFADSQTYP
ncbi:TIGR03960 family B12-binding radical SAM protein [uncultured Desulfovibrio sp.]|uniref:TIGR03960 family B12-binding radical SAM protein n=1 Tax=uncultured Desulfovibrio sp. TaxID=167968 RepID=UPI00260C1D5B|nr:TIGR03960 family B12-binding radical SAM protein [uncultured Desulfovibrio sp.]